LADADAPDAAGLAEADAAADGLEAGAVLGAAGALAATEAGLGAALDGAGLDAGAAAPPQAVSSSSAMGVVLSSDEPFMCPPSLDFSRPTTKSPYRRGQ